MLLIFPHALALVRAYPDITQTGTKPSPPTAQGRKNFSKTVRISTADCVALHSESLR
jgi:hypothetical protein